MKTGQIIATEITLNWCAITCTQSVVVIITSTIYGLLIMCPEFYINYFKINTLALGVKYCCSPFLEWIKERPGKFKYSQDTDLARKVRAQESISACSSALILWVIFTPWRNFECPRPLATLLSGRFLFLWVSISYVSLFLPTPPPKENSWSMASF